MKQVAREMPNIRVTLPKTVLLILNTVLLIIHFSLLKSTFEYIFVLYSVIECMINTKICLNKRRQA